MSDSCNKEQAQSMAYALRLLSRREFFRAEIEQRLRIRDFSECCILQTVERLIRQNYLNEDRYCRAFFRVHLRRGEAPGLIAAKARRQGVQLVAVETALEDCRERYDPIEACSGVLARRDPQKLYHEDRKIWQKHARYLKNKGFDAATIVRVMNADEGACPCPVP